MHSQHCVTPLLTTKHLSWHIQSRAILNDINIAISPGQCVGLIGPNGAGKSSLLRCLYRYTQPTTGVVEFNGKNIWQLSAKDYATSVAVVLQETPTQFNLTVFDVVALGLTPHKPLFSASTGADYGRIVNALEKVGLALQANQQFSVLSGGEKQRALIARSIVQQPQLLIMDEPTSHLDVKYQIQIMELAKSLGVTVLASFHDLNLASAMCDSLIVIDQGTVFHSGTPDEVLTEAMLKQVFGVCANITAHPQSTAAQPFPQVTYFYGDNKNE